MPDRIPELDRLAATAKEVPVLPASEIRRRGNRRRATRRTVGVLGACALLAVGGFGIAQVTGRQEPGWATPQPVTPTPSISSTASPSAPTSPDPVPSQTPDATAKPTPTPTDAPGEAVKAPTFDNMPTPDQLFIYGDIPGAVKDEFEGQGQSSPSICLSEIPGEPSTILTREMGLEGDEWPTLYVATIFGYDDEAQASAAFDSLRQQSLDCGERLDAQGWRDSGARENTDEIPFTPPANAPDARFANVLAVGLPAGDASLELGQWVDVVIIQTGSRVLFLSQAFEGQDYNCSLTPDDGNAAQCPALAAADAMAERLAG